MPVDASPTSPPRTTLDHADGPPGSEPAGEAPRRRFLLGAGAAAVAAAGVVASASSAGAANGDNLKVGQANTGTATTSLTGSQLKITDGNGSTGMTVIQSGTDAYGVIAQAVGSGAVGMVAQSIAGGGSWGLYAYSAGSDGVRSDTAKTGAAGVHGTATNGDGVFGSATQGTGVRGQSGKGAGVSGVCSGANGTGVSGQATGPTGSGVFGEAGGTGTGVSGNADLGPGVYAYSAGGPSLLLQGDAVMPPTTGTWQAGSIVFNDGLWLCLESGVGTASRWVKLSRTFVPLEAPVRIYDSRPGKAPAVGTKAPLSDGEQRDIVATTGGKVPAGLATALAVNLTVTETGPAGFVSLYRNGIAWPGNSSINWTESGTTIANGTIVAVDAAATFTARAKSTCHLVVDVLGFYT